ncbi:hypothetical protein DAMA08_020280 [Martiniozyma asiatica (nom. inval.)]|nr:hypothetical protein DAMA08_020280 [Martiniozyma asiatica]
MSSNSFSDSQKIIYELKPRKGTKKHLNEIPFVRLLGGREPSGNVEMRYNLYTRNWERQLRSIESVLDKNDRFKFRNLKKFLNGEDDQSKKSYWKRDDRLITGLLHFGSNIANHGRLLKNVCDYIQDESDGERVCLIKINASTCTQMDHVIKTIEDEVMKRVQELESSRGKVKRRRVNKVNRLDLGFSEDEDDDDEEEINDDEEEEEEEEEDEEDSRSHVVKSEIDSSLRFMGKREVDNEFQAVGVKVESNLSLGRRTRSAFKKEDSIGAEEKTELALPLGKKLEKSAEKEQDDEYSHKLSRGSKFIDLDDLMDDLRASGVKIILLIENADAMNTDIISRILKLLWNYSKSQHVSCIIGISTPFLIFQEKIPKMLLKILKTQRFQIDNSNEAINQIMEDLLLNINETYSSLIFEPKLVLEFLKDKEEISIQQFYNYMKSIYMRHYFSEPMSIFWTNDFSGIDLSKEYFEVFKKLPSIMKDGEKLEDEFLQGILSDSPNIVGKYLRINLNKLINWRFNFRNLIDFLNFIQAFLTFDKIWNNNLDLFQMIFGPYYQSKKQMEDNLEILTFNNNKLKLGDSPFSKIFKFLNPLWESLESMEDDQLENLIGQLKEDDQFLFITSHSEFPDNLITALEINQFIKCVNESLINQVIELDLTNQPFREICVIDSSMSPLLKQWFNPQIRDVTMDVLDSSHKLLFNEKYWKFGKGGLDWELFKIFEPSVCELYRSYKDAGVVVNVYDFYQVFKENVIDKKRFINLLIEKLTNGGTLEGFEFGERKICIEDLKLMYEQFENNSKSELWDKMILSWFLRNVHELEILGLLNEGKNKSMSLEKVVWKGI